MDLHEYFGLCCDHDWFFDFNRTTSKYEVGLNEMNVLLKYYRLDKKYKDVFEAWCDYMKYGDADKPIFEDFK